MNKYIFLLIGKNEEEHVGKEPMALCVIWS